MSRHISWLMVLLSLFLLAGCGSDNTATNTAGSDPRLTPGGTDTVFAQFDASVLPLPNDVTWAADGDPAVDLPLAHDGSELDQLKTLVNAQGILGLSPNMFLTIPLTGEVDSSTLAVQVFRVDDATLLNNLFVAAQTNPTGVPAALAALDYRTQDNFVVVDDFTSGVIKLLPKTPFVPGAGYAVVVGPGLTDSNDYPAVSSFTMQALKSHVPFATDSPYYSFEDLRAAFNDGPSALFTVVEGVTSITSNNLDPWTSDKVLVMWTFHTAASTLSLTPTAAAPANVVTYPDGGSNGFTDTTLALYGTVSANFPVGGNSLTWVDPLDSTNTSNSAAIPQTANDFFNGYLGGAYSTVPHAAMGNVYAGTYLSPLLDGSDTTTVTFRLTLPAVGSAPYPVVLFQHGITSSKDAAFGIANTLSANGYAILAIDAIYHGDRTTPGANSGDGFFTTNLLQDRANLYQSAIDLWEAVDVIEAGIDVDGGGNDIDNTSSIEFMAHSLGSIIGSVFLSQESRVDQIVLSSPSALLVNVLDETSLSDLQALVTSLGYTPGSTEYYVFLDLAQWLLDPADGSYMGIGSNSTANLLNIFAYGDPIVTPTSTQVFMTNIFSPAPPTIVEVDPDTYPAGFPVVAGDFSAGNYQYGGVYDGVEKPVVHSFLLSPLFDETAEPYYAGYIDAIQVKATGAAQAQVYGFLVP